MQDFAMEAIIVDEVVLYLENLDSDLEEEHKFIEIMRREICPGLRRWSMMLWEQTPGVVLMPSTPRQEMAQADLRTQVARSEAEAIREAAQEVVDLVRAPLDSPIGNLKRVLARLALAPKEDSQ
jgi:hypothetical protein